MLFGELVDQLMNFDGDDNEDTQVDVIVSDDDGVIYHVDSVALGGAGNIEITVK